jgi:hypothetical protein
MRRSLAAAASLAAAPTYTMIGTAMPVELPEGICTLIGIPRATVTP